MTDIRVTPLGQTHFEVEIGQGNDTTTHQVSVPSGLLESLGLSDADEERVVRESFAFLLEREPATSILTEFSLDAISRYFPEYHEELPRRLRG